MKEIKEIFIEAYIQATEDPNKVIKAIKNVVPPELREDGGQFITENVRGVFHNPITIIRVKFVQMTREIVEYLASKLLKSDKQYLLQSIKRRIEKGNLYLRLGKQELYQNIMEIKEIKDIIKIRISFSKKYGNQKDMMRILQEIGLIEA